MFLNRSYWPDAEATGQLLTELCEDLSDRFDVTVIAGQPNHNPTNESFSRSQREQHNNVTIERVWHPQMGKQSMLARAMGLIGFLIAATARAFRMKSPDVVVVETDPFMLPWLGRWLKWWHGSRFIVYLQDLYPDVAVVLGKVREGWLTRFLRWRLTEAYRRADAIIVLSGDMRARLVEWGLDATKIHCVENWVDTSLVFPAKKNNQLRQREGLQDRFVIMHSGNMGLSQYLDNVLNAAALLSDRSDMQILLVGDGATRCQLEDQAIQLKLNNVRFLPYQPREELAQSLSAADIHLISMHPEAHHCLMPSKLYGILASGSAVVAITAEDSELARIIRHEQVGLTVQPGDPQKLADQLRWCVEHRDELRMMGERARLCSIRNYDRKRQTARFGSFLAQPAAEIAELNSNPRRTPETSGAV